MKKYKKMLGDTIYRLRKEKGLSQSELGYLVGVSNKAVSKWETDEANPDIQLLPLLASVLGVSTDELLTDIKTEENDFKPKENSLWGIKGTVTDTAERYEFISDKKTKNGTPYLHIHLGRQITTLNAKARGLIAIGNNAKGLIGIGLLSCGLLSFGILSIGLFALGVLSLGLILAEGAIAIGAAAFGAVAVGIVAFGAVAVGYVSVGALSIGYYAHTGTDGYAIGKNVFYHLNSEFKILYANVFKN
jgi:transcriptional regulator with XRE-family HTH domain